MASLVSEFSVVGVMEMEDKMKPRIKITKVWEGTDFLSFVLNFKVHHMRWNCTHNSFFKAKSMLAFFQNSIMGAKV
ncbi:hypothetical protein [Ureibacillus aquaedulcis]|uniref:Uncharacterized protein n=1 Tax=Ureibacillus aquaedulcis TaxID=3058421 RepID=A0ABT8GTT4_9BACL|nr:hypothetical protein [Ureibacillus sp. BA0131]MDN4494746.1 hypothetical protein [Ureibacillus sp. BA0131]